MKVLIIHHLEEMWQAGYKKFGTDYESLQELFVEYLTENEFDHVILTRFEDWKLGDEHYLIAPFINKVYDYAYAWDAECLENDPDNFVKGGDHSEAVLITDWIKNLRGHEVYLSGAFIGECLEDIQIALESQGIEPVLIDELCVG